MRTLMLLAVVAGLACWTAPQAAQAQVADAINLTNQAVKDLTDYPAEGKRYTAYNSPEDFNKTWGADVRNMKKANGELTEALAKAKAANIDKKGIQLLEMAIGYGNASEHKEQRLSAQGALFYLCKANNQEPKDICEKVPKYGSYTAP